MSNKNKEISQVVLENYKPLVQRKYGTRSNTWPILSGFNIINGEFHGYIICIFKHTGVSGVVASSVVEFDKFSLGSDYIDRNNIESVRESIRKAFNLDRMDSVIIAEKNSSNFNEELDKLLQYHEIIMGEVKMKIFLSHKGADKSIVRDYKKLLTTLGFDVWLDEDSMHAGSALHRSIQQGFKDSCAAIFFVTENYLDEDYLEMEINYAIEEKRLKKERFSLITLVFGNNENVTVPELLKPYVWKNPKNDIIAMYEILKSLPIKVGTVTYK